METKKLGEEKKYIYAHNKGEKFVMKRLWHRVTMGREGDIGGGVGIGEGSTRGEGVDKGGG